MQNLSHPKYRRDIDGLRAIAVLSVVAFHVFPNWMVGGFIGVDIFFVISGYLISTIIFENLDKETFSFAEFYARRVKRIFPAEVEEDGNQHKNADRDRVTNELVADDGLNEERE